MRLIELVSVLVAILSMFAIAFGAYFTLDEKHASNQKVLRTEIDLRKEILNRDIKKDAEARVFYKDIERTRDLEQAEQARLEYLEEQLEQKYERQNMYEEKAMELQ